MFSSSSFTGKELRDQFLSLAEQAVRIEAREVF